jgi:hypothetical protein
METQAKNRQKNTQGTRCCDSLVFGVPLRYFYRFLHSNRIIAITCVFMGDQTSNGPDVHSKSK